MLVYILLGVAIFGLAIAWVLWMMRTPADLEPSSKTREGWLFAKEADKINVRSADNVRALSEDQLDALEESSEENE